MYTTEFRALDVRLGRWFTPDPITQPWSSSYVSMDNSPITLTDVLGLKGDPVDCETFGPDGGGSNNVPILPSDVFSGSSAFSGGNIAGTDPKMGRVAGQTGEVVLPERKGTENVDFGHTDDWHFRDAEINGNGGVVDGRKYYQDPNLQNGTGGYYWVKDDRITGDDENRKARRKTIIILEPLTIKPIRLPEPEFILILTAIHKSIKKPDPIAPTGLLYATRNGPGSTWVKFNFDNQINTWVDWLKNNPDYKLVIEIGGANNQTNPSWEDNIAGKTDTYGDRVDQVKKAVEDALKSKGVNNTRFKVKRGNVNGNTNSVKIYR